MNLSKNKSREISLKIKEVRVAKLIKQDTLAKKVALSKSEISRIENGQRELKVSKLFEIASAIGMKMSAFFVDEQ